MKHVIKTALAFSALAGLAGWVHILRRRLEDEVPVAGAAADRLADVLGHAAGAAEGGTLDLANLLKPHLARGALRVIGATTTAEWRVLRGKDPALARRFQEVPLPEPIEL